MATAAARERPSTGTASRTSKDYCTAGTSTPWPTPGASDVNAQLDYVATHYRHTMLIIVVSDEPDVNDRLSGVLTRLSGRHDILWAMVSDMPAVGPDNTDGVDVATGSFVLNGADLGPRVSPLIAAPSSPRRDRLAAFLTGHAILTRPSPAATTSGANSSA